MPPDTLWSGNPNLEITLPQGNIAFDDTSTNFDSTTVNFDGAPIANLINIYTPNDTIWTEPNPL